MERNNVSSICSGSPKKHFREMILSSVHWSRRRCHLKVFFFFFFFLALSVIFPAEGNHLINFGRGSSKEHLSEIILETWLRRRFHFLFLALVAILYSGVETFRHFW